MNNNSSLRTESLLKKLAGGNAESLCERLAPGHVVVQVGSKALAKPQGQLLASFCANLAVRLFPVVQKVSFVIHDDAPLLFEPPRWRAATFVGHLKTFLNALQPLATWEVQTDLPEQLDCAIIIDPEGGPVAENSFFVGSDGWEATFSPSTSVPIGNRVNPAGAYAAACIAVAETWKRLLIPHRDIFDKVAIRPQRDRFTFSAFTYLARSGPNPELPPIVDLGRITVIGVGAGGGAALYTLASLEKLRGHVNAIDVDEIERPNLNRYVMADAANAADKTKKVTIAEDMLQPKGATVSPYPHSFRDCQGLQPSDFARVFAAVHTREARREIQFETPGVLWDAGATQEGDFRIWRMVMAVTECMHCKHPPGAEDFEFQKAAQIAQLLKLDLQTCLAKIRDNKEFTEDEIAAITKVIDDGGLKFDPPKPRQRLSDWEAEQCGKLKLPNIDDEVPIPFAPVMAGVLIAGEIIKERHFPDYVLDSRYSNTLMGQFVTRSQPIHVPAKPECKLCHDPAMLAQFKKRSAAGTA